jgi:hypothetical protein
MYLLFFVLTAVFLLGCGMMVNSAVLPEVNTVNSPFPNVTEYVVTAERLNVRDNMGVVVKDIYYLRGDVVIIREITDGWGKIAEDRFVYMEWLEER